MGWGKIYKHIRSVVLILTLITAIQSTINAQNANAYVYKGNEAYNKGQFEDAIALYKEALRKEPFNNIARFNYANALQRKNDLAASTKEYSGIISSTSDKAIQSNSYYNKALAELNQKELMQAITSFKNALKLNPDDTQARENLQLALNELKKQMNSRQQKETPARNDKEKEKKQPKMNKQLMEQKLNELRNQEKQLQQRLQKKSNSGQPEKDW